MNKTDPDSRMMRTLRRLLPERRRGDHPVAEIQPTTS